MLRTPSLAAAALFLVGLGLVAGPAAADCGQELTGVPLCEGGGEQPAPQPEPEPQPQPAPQPTLARDEAGAARLLELVNGERARAGLAPVAARGDVTDIASAHSNRMAERGDIWHNDEYFSAATRRRLGARALGENVAANSDVDDAHRRLMASPGHRANILDGRYTHAGFSVWVGRDGRRYITEDFLQADARPAVAAAGSTAQPVVATKPAPAPRATPAPAPAPVAPAPEPVQESASPEPVTPEAAPEVTAVTDGLAAAGFDVRERQSDADGGSDGAALAFALFGLAAIAGGGSASFVVRRRLTAAAARTGRS